LINLAAPGATSGQYPQYGGHFVTIWPLTALAVAAGGLVQGSIGVGFALVVSPALALLAPGLLPGCVLILMLPLTAYVARREWQVIDWRGVFWITLGRCAGGIAGLEVLALLPGGGLRWFVGLATILTAVGSMLSSNLALRPSVFIRAGIITGITDTATGIGGPPMALVYQHHPGPVLRATLAICFLVGELLSLLLLALGGRLEQNQLTAAVWLLPALAAGSLLSRWSHGRVDGRPMRLAMLGFAIVSGVACLV
jgi:uncharacterized membrane protein YfcA